MWVRRIIIAIAGSVLVLWAGGWAGGVLHLGPADLLDGSREPELTNASQTPDSWGQGDGLAKYGDQVPDYVVGTDWVGGKDVPVMADPVLPEPDSPSATVAPPPPKFTPQPLEPPPTPSYPSQGGDILSGHIAHPEN